MKFEPCYPDAIVPKRSTKLAAAYDLHAYEETVLVPGEIKLIKTGVTFNFEHWNDFNVGLGVSLDICSRSGLAWKQGVFVLNAPGVVDADYYPNEIGVILKNTGDKPIRIKKGDRIAQAKIVPCMFTSDDDAETEAKERTGGFGSTGQ